MWKQNAMQRDKVFRLMTMVRVTEQLATHYLQLYDWNMHMAYAGLKQYDNDNITYRELDKFYTRYCDRNNPLKISRDGISMLLSDLDLDSCSIYVLLLAWKCRARVQCVFTKEEFYKGMLDLKADTVSKLLKRLHLLEDQLMDTDKFRDFYEFTFEYAKEQNQRDVDIFNAIAYWNIVFKNRFVFLNEWCMFLTETKKRSINKDSWNLLFEFAQQAEQNIINYDINEAWPVIIDEFVQWFQEKSRAPQFNSTNLSGNKDNSPQQLIPME